MNRRRFLGTAFSFLAAGMAASALPKRPPWQTHFDIAWMGRDSVGNIWVPSRTVQGPLDIDGDGTLKVPPIPAGWFRTQMNLYADGDKKWFCVVDVKTPTIRG